MSVSHGSERLADAKSFDLKDADLHLFMYLFLVLLC